MEDIIKKIMENNYAFHVHTNYCPHASNDSMKDYIMKALDYGAKSIVFTEHAPFPGDILKSRMKYNQLDAYLEELNDLRTEFAGLINVYRSLETDWIPSQLEYIEDLAKNKNLDFLICGQHDYEDEQGVIHTHNNVCCDMHLREMEAMIHAAESGLFAVIAHPDRVFEDQLVWTEEMASLSKYLIETCNKNGIYLEQNYKSARYLFNGKRMVWPEFWQMNPVNIIKGCDAHRIKELIVNLK